MSPLMTLIVTTVISFNTFADVASNGQNITIPVRNIGEIQRSDDDLTKGCGPLVNVKALTAYLSNPFCYNHIDITAPAGSLVAVYDLLSDLVSYGLTYQEIRQSHGCRGCGVEQVSADGSYDIIFNRGYAYLEILTPDGRLIKSGRFYVPAATIARLKWTVQ